jgi:hypothetical protein
MRRPGEDDDDEKDSDHAGERLREFVERRFPDGPLVPTSESTEDQAREETSEAAEDDKGGAGAAGGSGSQE